MDRGTLVAEEAAPGGSMSPPDLTGFVVASLTMLLASGSTLTVLTSTGFDGSGTVAGKVSATGATGVVSAVLAIELVDDMAILALR
jgi:hypothetical protein